MNKVPLRLATVTALAFCLAPVAVASAAPIRSTSSTPVAAPARYVQNLGSFTTGAGTTYSATVPAAGHYAVLYSNDNPTIPAYFNTVVDGNRLPIVNTPTGPAGATVSVTTQSFPLSAGAHSIQVTSPFRGNGTITVSLIGTP